MEATTYFARNLACPPRVVFFDADGVLNDIETVRNRLWPEAAARHGVHGLEAKEFRVTLGLKADDVLEQVRKLVAPEADYEEGINLARAIKKTRDKLVDQFLETEGVPGRPGHREILDALGEARVPAFVVTSSRRTVAERLLEGLGIRQCFQSIVTGDEVKQGKPDPECYKTAHRQAAALLRDANLPPAACLVIEDSNNGGEAGLNAEMPTAIVPCLEQPNSRLQGEASAILRSLKEVKEWLLRQVGRC